MPCPQDKIRLKPFFCACMARSHRRLPYNCFAQTRRRRRARHAAQLHIACDIALNPKLPPRAISAQRRCKRPPFCATCLPSRFPFSLSLSPSGDYANTLSSHRGGILPFIRGAREASLSFCECAAGIKCAQPRDKLRGPTAAFCFLPILICPSLKSAFNAKTASDSGPGHHFHLRTRN